MGVSGSSPLGGYGSLLGDSPRPIAQLVEYRSPKPRVVGSSPTGPGYCTEKNEREKVLSILARLSEKYPVLSGYFCKAALVSSSKEGCMKRLIQYFKDSYAEMKKVMWPTKDEVSSSTVVVLVSVVIFATLLGLVDFILANVIEFLF